jgi:hypothetical protein
VRTPGRLASRARAWASSIVSSAPAAISSTTAASTRSNAGASEGEAWQALAARISAVATGRVGAASKSARCTLVGASARGPSGASNDQRPSASKRPGRQRR